MESEFSNGDNSEKESSPLSDLPTTPEIVKEGVGMFEDFLEGIDNERLRSILLRHTALQACLLGLRPEIHIDTSDPLLRLDDAEWAELAGSFEKVTDSIVSVISENEEGADWRLLNTKAAEHVIKSHPDYFPKEAQMSPVRWLAENPQEWTDSTRGRTQQLRYGLLSGIPEWDILPYEQYSAVNQLVADSDLDNETVESIYSKLRRETPLTPEEKDSLMGVFDEHFPEIGEEERKIFLSHTWVKPQLGVHFAGFDSERDTKYVRALNSLVENSDLNLVMKRFSGDRNDEKEEVVGLP